MLDRILQEMADHAQSHPKCGHTCAHKDPLIAQARKLVRNNPELKRQLKILYFAIGR